MGLAKAPGVASFPRAPGALFQAVSAPSVLSVVMSKVWLVLSSPGRFGRGEDQASGGHLWAGEHQAHRGLQGQVRLH